MTSPSLNFSMQVIQDKITKLVDDYEPRDDIRESILSLYSSETLLRGGLLGSRSAVFLSSETDIRLYCLGCIAAPFVSMVAKNWIDLDFGSKLFAPGQLHITTDRLYIGSRFEVIEPAPAHGFVTCNELHIGAVSNETAQIVKSWITKDCKIFETQIEASQ